VAEAAAKNLTRCILELGGKCPCVVHHSADLAHAVDKLCFSKFWNSGQTCVAPDYIFVDERVVKRFTELMIETIKRFWGTNPNGSDSQGKIINQFHVKRLERLIDTAGGQKIYGGRSNPGVKHIEPTIILNPDMESELMQDEIFGPIMPILVYKNIEDVCKMINSKPKPLAVYFYGNANSKDGVVLFNKTSSGAFMTNECLM